MGYQLFRKPLPTAKATTSLAPTTTVCPSFSHPYPGKWGLGEREGGRTDFLRHKAVSTLQKQRQSRVRVNGLANTVTKIHQMGGVPPPSVLPALEEPRVRATGPQDTWPSSRFMELTAILHKVQTARASVCGPSAAAKLWTARGRSSTTCTRTLTHTLARPSLVPPRT